MTKTNKLFSWLGFGKGKTEQTTTPATPDVTPVQSHTSIEVTAAEALATPNQDKQSQDTPSQDTPNLAPSNHVTPSTAEVIEPSPDTSLASTQAAPTQPAPASTSTSQAPDKAEIAATPVPEQTAAVVAPSSEPQVSVVQSVHDSASTAVEPEKKLGFFARLRQGLAKTSANLGNGLASLFLGKKIDDELYEELETQLLLADVGIETSQKLIRQLTEHADRKQLKDAEALYDKLQDEMAEMLAAVEQPLDVTKADGPYVILMVGVNGVGKTTTIGKMAQQFRQQGKTVMLAAGDTFRAAAVEQLQVWGERNNIPVIAQHTGADSASVIFDAYQAAKARGVDVLIADTAGRLQNKTHLMEELKKIVRVMKKIDDAAPHEVMLTLDAGTGQNALSQAKIFHEAVQLTGISLTKLDGTAKGGVIFAIADQFKLPIRYIGVGEGLDDLRVFQSRDFIKALFNKES